MPGALRYYPVRHSTCVHAYGQSTLGRSRSATHFSICSVTIATNGENLCHISDALKVFQKEYTFLQTIRLTNDGVIFRLNPRRDLKNISVNIDVWDISGKKVINFVNSDHAPYPNPPASVWIWPQKLTDGLYLVEVKLESERAYKAEITLGDTLF
jgi:hypothetical protein